MLQMEVKARAQDVLLHLKPYNLFLFYFLFRNKLCTPQQRQKERVNGRTQGCDASQVLSKFFFFFSFYYYLYSTNACTYGHHYHQHHIAPNDDKKKGAWDTSDMSWA